MSDAGTLTRGDLCEAIHSEIGLSRSECAKLVESVISEMGDALARGETVKISGFGTFNLRDKPERMGRNPKTGVEVRIPDRRVMTFRPSKRMRDEIARN